LGKKALRFFLGSFGAAARCGHGARKGWAGRVTGYRPEGPKNPKTPGAGPMAAQTAVFLLFLCDLRVLCGEFSSNSNFIYRFFRGIIGVYYHDEERVS
jgi:hypothetical protein